MVVFAIIFSACGNVKVDELTIDFDSYYNSLDDIYNIPITVKYDNGDIKEIKLKEADIEGLNQDADGTYNVKITYGGVAVEVSIVIKKLYTIEYAASSGGSITGEASQNVLSGGNGKRVEATADEGYIFDGWSDGSKNAAHTVYNINSNRVITAQFIEKQIKVSVTGYNLNTGGFPEDNIYFIDKNGSVELPEIELSGYVHLGYTTNRAVAGIRSAGTAVQYQLGVLSNITENTTVYPIFIPCDKVLTFINDQTGQELFKIIREYNREYDVYAKAVELLDNMTTDTIAYTYLWKIDGTEVVNSTAFTRYKLTQDTVVRLHITKQTRAITYNYDGISLISYIEYGDDLDIHNNFSLSGGNYDSTGHNSFWMHNNIKYSEGDIINNITAPVVFTLYLERKAYTVNFIDIVEYTNNGGVLNSSSIIKTETALFLNSILLPPSPNKPNYVFEGWYRDQDRTIKYTFGEPIIENTDIYANYFVKLTLNYSVANATVLAKGIGRADKVLANNSNVFVHFNEKFMYEQEYQEEMLNIYLYENNSYVMYKSNMQVTVGTHDFDNWYTTNGYVNLIDFYSGFKTERIIYARLFFKAYKVEADITSGTLAFVCSGHSNQNATLIMAESGLYYAVCSNPTCRNVRYADGEVLLTVSGSVAITYYGVAGDRLNYIKIKDTIIAQRNASGGYSTSPFNSNISTVGGALIITISLTINSNRDIRDNVIPIEVSTEKEPISLEITNRNNTTTLMDTTINPNIKNTFNLLYGDYCELILNPTAGHNISNLVINNASGQNIVNASSLLYDSASGIYRYIINGITSNTTITVNTIPIQYNVVLNSSGDGLSRITQPDYITSGSTSYGYNGSVYMTMTPHIDNELASISINGVVYYRKGNIINPDSRISLTTSGDTVRIRISEYNQHLNVQVEYSPPFLSLSVSVVDGTLNSVSIDGENKIVSSTYYSMNKEGAYGDALVINHSGKVGYHLGVVRINGEVVPSVPDMLTKDMDIEIIYLINEYTLSITDSYGGISKIYDGNLYHTGSLTYQYSPDVKNFTLILEPTASLGYILDKIILKDDNGDIELEFYTNAQGVIYRDFSSHNTSMSFEVYYVLRKYAVTVSLYDTDSGSIMYNSINSNNIPVSNGMRTIVSNQPHGTDSNVYFYFNKDAMYIKSISLTIDAVTSIYSTPSEISTITNSSTYTISKIMSEVIIIVEYAYKEYSITLQAPSNCTYSLKYFNSDTASYVDYNPSVMYRHGSTFKVVITPNAYYDLNYITINSTTIAYNNAQIIKTGNTYEYVFTFNANTTVTATMRKQVFAVTIVDNQPSGLTVSDKAVTSHTMAGDGKYYVDALTNIYFSVSLRSEFSSMYIVEVTVDNVAVTPSGINYSYEIITVTRITINYRLINYNLNIKVTGANSNNTAEINQIKYTNTNINIEIPYGSDIALMLYGNNSQIALIRVKKGDGNYVEIFNNTVPSGTTIIPYQSLLSVDANIIIEIVYTSL